MNLKNFKITSRGLYWGLIVAFVALYVFVGFVSTLHSITFFQLANSIGLAILLGITYEVGQAAVLFSVLMTKNKDQFLPWVLMILLTALQVTANVFASFKWMVESKSTDWIYWQKAILIGVTATPETYMIIIAWIIGGLLPVVALGMTALVAAQLKHIEESQEPQLTVDDLIPTPATRGMYMPEAEVPDVSKKAKEPIEEEAYVPKYKRFVSPLKKKSHIERVSDITKLTPPSKGDEAIALIEKEEKAKVKESINQEMLSNLVQHEIQPESFKDPANESQVIDVEAVPKPKVVQDFWGNILKEGT